VQCAVKHESYCRHGPPLTRFITVASVVVLCRQKNSYSYTYSLFVHLASVFASRLTLASIWRMNVAIIIVSLQKVDIRRHVRCLHSSLLSLHAWLHRQLCDVWLRGCMLTMVLAMYRPTAWCIGTCVSMHSYKKPPTNKLSGSTACRVVSDWTAPSLTYMQVCDQVSDSVD